MFHEDSSTAYKHFENDLCSDMTLWSGFVSPRFVGVEKVRSYLPRSALLFNGNTSQILYINLSPSAALA